MKNKRKPQYDWDPNLGIATCYLFDKNNVFVGMAMCHPEDEEFKNDKTGLHIAEARATIKMLQHIKNNELKPQLDGLKQYYNSINKSKNYNKKSYEAKMLWRQMKVKKRDIGIVNDIIAKEKVELQKYIADKNEFYQKVSKNRDKKD